MALKKIYKMQNLRPRIKFPLYYFQLNGHRFKSDFIDIFGHSSDYKVADEKKQPSARHLHVYFYDGNHTLWF